MLPWLYDKHVLIMVTIWGYLYNRDLRITREQGVEAPKGGRLIFHLTPILCVLLLRRNTNTFALLVPRRINSGQV